jgi:hypothetical protein
MWRVEVATVLLPSDLPILRSLFVAHFAGESLRFLILNLSSSQMPQFTKSSK